MLRRHPVLFLLVLGSCSGKAVDPLQPPLGLEANKIALTAYDDPITADKVELGKILFFDPRLSKSGAMSCSTCHLPAQAWVDNKQFSPKDDGSLNTRNTPAVFNVGYLDKLYWDGRTPTLEKNILAAWKAQLSGDPAAVAGKLAGVAAYQQRFQQAFGQPASEDTIVKALAAFLRTLRNGNSPFDRWQHGDQTAIGNDAKAGYDLFMGKAGCNACHAPPLFTDRGFHNAGIGLDAAQPDPGAGGEKALNDPQLIGAFKTPTLRSVARTGPWFHDGSATTLEEAVRFMAGGGRDNPNLDPALRAMREKKFSDQEIRQLVAFLESLTGEVAFTPPQVP